MSVDTNPEPLSLWEDIQRMLRMSPEEREHYIDAEFARLLPKDGAEAPPAAPKHSDASTT